MSKVHIAKLTCPKGHILYAAAFEEGRDSLEGIKRQVGVMASALGRRLDSCGLCGPTGARWVDEATDRDSLEAAADLMDAVMDEIAGLQQLVHEKRRRESFVRGFSKN